MTKSANIEAIEKTTGKSWNQWVELLDSAGARDMEHKTIAERVRTELEDSLENAGWWAQGVTVAYEQYIGRRQPGQQADGSFEITASRTFDSTMDEVITRWIAYVAHQTEFNGIKLAETATTSKTEKGRHWGCNLLDGTRVNADTYPKSPEKTVFAITHIRLADQEVADSWRAYWKTIIKEV